MLRAVLDPNIFASAVLQPQGTSGQLLNRFLRESAFEMVLSPAIVEEVLQVLAYPKVRKRVRGDVPPDLWFEDLLALADLVPDRTPPDVCPTPGDDKYLAAAMEGRATFVVTAEKGFLAVEEHERVRLVSPAAFLGLLGAAAPAV